MHVATGKVIRKGKWQTGVCAFIIVKEFDWEIEWVHAGW